MLNTKYDIDFVLTFHSDVKGDLQRIREKEPEAFAKLAALFRQLQSDSRLTEKLLDHGFGDDRKAEISVSKWMNQWKEGKNLWRLKSWDMEKHGMKYRVIYLYLPNEARFVVMAVVARGEFNYDDDDHPIRKRITESLRRTYGIS